MTTTINIRVTKRYDANSLRCAQKTYREPSMF